MTRYKSPQLVREKEARLRRQRRKETSFLVLIIVLMVLVSAVYGVWMYHKIQNRPKHHHQHRHKKSEKKAMRDSTHFKHLFEFTIIAGRGLEHWVCARQQSSSIHEQSCQIPFEGIS